ncbi:hypothetical protein SO802_003417 [Lithocarpus litseifolius]|uniref:Agenet domain-containing protein n=1 Tax=Lithocarpus litseifolius TaxID=425828 RepID=A0AAW2E3I5_9ROSI
MPCGPISLETQIFIFKQAIIKAVIQKRKEGFVNLSSVLSYSNHEILKGDVMYEGSIDMRSEEVIERVPRKDIRPCPPPTGNMEGWTVGDVAEVFNFGSWRMAMILKGSRNCELVKFNKPSSLNCHQMTPEFPQLNTRRKMRAGNTCLVAQDNTCLQESHIVSSRTLKRASPYCSSHTEAYSRKMRVIENEGHWICYQGSFLDHQVLSQLQPRQLWRECPPMETMEDWAVGDVAEVFDVGSWRMAMILKGSRNCELVKFNKPCSLNCHQMTPEFPQLDTRRKMQAGDTCLAAQDNICLQESHIVLSRTLKRASPYCSSHTEAYSGKMRASFCDFEFCVSIAIMRFLKGSKVEVLKNKQVPPGEWHCAKIISGNGHTYSVMYEGSLAITAEAVVERVPRKAIRPCPPPMETMEDWAVGDVAEVFNVGSWRMAMILKGSCNSLLVKSNKPSSLNFHQMTSEFLPHDTRKKMQAGNTCLAAQDDTCLQEAHVVSSRTLKRASPYCSTHTEAYSGKMRGIEKEGVLYLNACKCFSLSRRVLRTCSSLYLMLPFLH